MRTWQERAGAWQTLKPPARPSPGDIVEYEKALRPEVAAHPAPACLILGATPELRSLAHANDCRVFCADTSRTMFEALRPMVAPAGPEELLCVDWLELPSRLRFDVVLGDGAVNMIPTARHSELLEGLARVVAPGGAAILRVHLRTPPLFEDLEAVLGWCRREGRGSPFYTVVRTPFYMFWLALKGGDVIDTAEVYDFFRRLHAAGRVTDEEFSSLTPTDMRLYLPGREMFEELASRWFAIERIRHGADCLHPGNHPIYVLRGSRGGAEQAR